MKDMALVPVYRAANQSIADIVKALLESEGIPIVFKSMQVPMYDGIMVMGEGYWGDLLVPENLAEQAREIVNAYEGDGDSS